MSQLADISAFKLVPGAALAQQSLADPLDNGQQVVGTSKLAQRVIVELLKVKGSIPFDNGGCTFRTYLNNQARTESDVFVAFFAAAHQVVTYLQSLELSTEPASEKIASLTATKLVLSPGTITMTIVITNKAGTKQNVSLPLNFVLAGG